MNHLRTSILFGLSAMACQSFAGSEYHRLVWDGTPSSSATIGFSPTSSSNHHVKYGFTPDEQQWTKASISFNHTFDGSLNSSFVQLNRLPSNAAIYYRVCDDAGCGDRLWFQTAPNDSSPFVAIAGGDTRTGWTNRRAGNKLVSKIRPLFIMHGGDYTNQNSASEMREYLKDWQLTFSNDLIDGLNYKRIYPFVPTHGNHEDDNYSTVCQVFGVDFDGNKTCNPKDTYGAFNVSPLLRVYTLNTQFKDSGWSSYARAMNNWLRQDLTANANSAKWRVAQYHKPMYPHYSRKRDNTILVSWWANLFYQHKMNLVVESDTHINKVTEALKPSGSDFTATTSGGTVYVGEGSWGAPARSANDPKSWTIDLASIQQFKVLSVSPNTLDVRTAQFGSGAETLSREQRNSNPLALPSGVNWWSASQIGEVLKLTRASNHLSVINKGSIQPIPNPPKTIKLKNGQAVSAISGSKDQTLSYTIDIPSNATELSITTRGGSGDVDLYVRYGSKPTTNRHDCRPYENGNNESCSFSSPKTGTYYVNLKGYSSFSGVTLKANFSISSGGDDGSGGDGGSDTNCDTSDILVYPNWPQTDWAGKPSHANSSDKMVYQGKIYQAKYWTNSIPGSDGSWKQVCGQ